MKKNILSGLSLALLTVLSGATLLLLGIEGRAESVDVTPKTVMYVEVNDNDFNNVAKYTLEGTDKPAFDIGIVFAANINYDSTTKKPYLYLNRQVQQTLQNSDKQIKPVQARGTKVLLSVLGNHQGAGFANFPTYESADAFAAELVDVVNKYDLDGIDFDDEYAEYGKNGTPLPNSNSFIWLLQSLRKRLGDDKLITFYNIGPSAELSKNNPKLSNFIDYAWNPYYSTWNPPHIVNMPKSRLGASAVEVGRNQGLAAQFAKRTIEEQYGIYLMYNLQGKDSSDYISAATQELYGRKTIYTPEVLK